jgi:hypothetical protein
MNLKTWFKGMGVFVLSSLITAAATMTLDPASFNFTKAGLEKVGLAALVIGIKAVLLYLKQSPLPGSQANFTNWSKISSVMVLCVIIPATGLFSGCVNSWEQTTYASLAASKALIDCAVAGYNRFDADIRQSCSANPQDPAFDPTQFYLPQTREAQSAVEKARQIQVAAVEAFAAYATAKVGKDTTASLADKQAAVIAYVQQLPNLVNAIRVFMGKNQIRTSATTIDLARPLAAIEALNPAMELRR